MSYETPPNINEMGYEPAGQPAPGVVGSEAAHPGQETEVPETTYTGQTEFGGTVVDTEYGVVPTAPPQALHRGVLGVTRDMSPGHNASANEEPGSEAWKE